MRVAEIYQSVQGEGLLTGMPSVFVRTSGCNLRCRFCDTPYTSWKPEGEDYSVNEVLAHIQHWAVDHVVITGGEPMLYSELVALCDGLHCMARHVTIETAGTRYLPLECDLMSISPKMSNSTPSFEQAGPWYQRHDATRQAVSTVRQLVAEFPYQLKFVIQTIEDVHEALAYVEQLDGVDGERVLLMPEGTDVESLHRIGQWLEPFCQQHGLRFCPRKHIEWFGFRRGT